jgi:hypothetical protein
MDSFAVEHVVPRSRGGETRLDNLALSCQGCNNRKYTKTKGRDPKTGKMAPLYDPRRQRWTDHFTWTENLLFIVGLTPTGRATVEELEVNREGLVNLRRVLADVGEHPPRHFVDPDGPAT